MSETYLYLNGIKRLAEQSIGDEKIHMGIRPYEMHAGNLLAIVVYPMLLCEEMLKLGKTPRFNFILSLNDWEQDALVGEDIYKFTFDVKPKDTTIQYCKMPSGDSLAKHWGEKIYAAAKKITEKYPEVRITPVFNSQLQNDESMKHVIMKTLQEPDALKNIMLEASGRPTNHQLKNFAAAVCPNCKHANTNTIIKKSVFYLDCDKCKAKFEGGYSDFSYWLYHKPLFSARWKIFNFSHSLSGGDHFSEGDVAIRRKLYEFYFETEPPRLDMVFSPVLIGDNGQKMSKSRSNYFSVELEKLLKEARHNPAPEIVLEAAAFSRSHVKVTNTMPRDRILVG